MKSMPRDGTKMIACQQKISETFNLTVTQRDKKLNHQAHYKK